MALLATVPGIKIFVGRKNEDFYQGCFPNFALHLNKGVFGFLFQNALLQNIDEIKHN